MRFCTTVLVLLCASTLAPAEDAAAKEKKKNEAELAKIDAELKKKPDDPQIHVRRAQCLVRLARYDDAHEEAARTVAAFVKAGDATAFFVMETVDLGNVFVEIRCNMGPKERKAPEMGIVRPFAFRILARDAKGKPGEELEVINFELGYIGGSPETAAFGQERPGGGHSNFGLAKAADKYGAIRERGLELAKKRHPAEEKKEPEAGK